MFPLQGECWHGHAYVHVHNSLLVTAFSVWSTSTTLALRLVINDEQIYTSPHALMSVEKLMDASYTSMDFPINCLCHE